ncbi:hypothetical protein N7486_005052 [Penicillium sp. IBT 16267x]|nr:hypothetical protein N7486_005052 [Penicillium sp. IBT 16267x]
MPRVNRLTSISRNNSIALYTAVRYFNGYKQETRRYSRAISDFQWFQFHSSLRGILLNTTQKTVLLNYLLLIGLITVYQVSTGLRPVVGKYKGGIKFQGIKFSYNARKPILRGLLESLVEANQLLSSLFIGCIMPLGDAKDRDVYEAYRAARIHDQIVAFPDGYNTKVGEQGSLLSGDEATAALDTSTEKHILQSLKTLATGRTLLIIAHRLSTVIEADKIIVIYGGKVAKSRTHQQLLIMNGRYANLWLSQSTTPQRIK